MDRLTLIILLGIISNFFYSQGQYAYPKTHIVDQNDTYFGTQIADPYRWLENQESEETKKWVAEQNDFSQKYLSKISKTFSLRQQIKKNTEVKSVTPERKGDYYFELRTKFGGKELVIYYKKDFQKDYWEELFITKDLKVKNEENISVSEYEVSNDSKYIAYTFDKNGSDWKELKIADLDKQKSLPDHLYDIKHTSIVWRADGFYYTRYDRGNSDEQYKQLTLNAKLYYHKIGTTQDKDSLIFKKSETSNNFFHPIISKDERYLIINDHDPVNNTHAYYYIDFKNSDQKSLLPLFKKSLKYFEFIGAENDSLFFTVKINDEKKVIAVNPKNPLRWTEKTKTIDDLIVLSARYYNGKFYKLGYYNQQEVIVIIDNAGHVLKKDRKSVV